MPIQNLLTLVAPPTNPIESGNNEAWDSIQKRLGLRLPGDLRLIATHYGSGSFATKGLIIDIWNPFSCRYLNDVLDECQYLRTIRVLPEDREVPYGVFPSKPGWLPCGSDIYGGLICWLTEGDPEHWPLLLLSRERTSFQQIHLPLISFLISVFTRRIPTILWSDPDYFAEPLSFRPLREPGTPVTDNHESR